MPKKTKEININKIIQGDCLIEIKKMADKSVDLILTDPPYGIDISHTGKIDNTGGVDYNSLKSKEWGVLQLRDKSYPQGAIDLILLF